MLQDLQTCSCTGGVRAKELVCGFVKKWSNKVAVGPVIHNVNHPVSQPTAKLNAQKQAADIQQNQFIAKPFCFFS